MGNIINTVTTIRLYIFNTIHFNIKLNTSRIDNYYKTII